MARYELSEKQIELLRQILATVQIRGADAPAIIDLATALNKPLPKKEEKI